MLIEIPFKTPTINHLYGQRGFHRYMKPEAKKLKLRINEIVKKTLVDMHTTGYYKDMDHKLKVVVEVYENWICKNGSVAKKDVSNREKFLIDCIFEALELDDKFIWEQTFKKIESVEEKSIIKIEPI